MIAKGTLPTPLDVALRQQARALWERGESYGAIEFELGVKPSTLKSWRKRDGWGRIKTESNELVIAPDPAIAEGVPDDLPSQQAEYSANMAKAGVLLSRRVATMPADEVIQKADKIAKGDLVSRKALKLETDKPVCAIQIGVLCAPVRPSKKDDGRLRSTHNPVELIEADSELRL